MPGWKEISDFVLKYDYCCGCGVCAGVCPQNALEIRFNEYGEYKPYLVGNCTDCGLCSKVCPFVNGNPNEDDIGKAKFGNIEGIKHTPESGYYLNSYVGYAADPKIRWNGASGGLTTWLLCELLEKRKIDHVVTVAPNENPNKLFEYRVVSDLQNVRACSKSAYYPVELSDVLRHIYANPRRYAVVGLPCFLKAISLACEIIPALRESIVYKVGLVCGQLKSTYYTDYLASMVGISRPLKKVAFRVKDLHQPSNNYGFEAEDVAGRGSGLLWNEGVSSVWASGWFCLNACRYCDDIFAECADVVLLDAWLKDYEKDAAGTNLAIDRTGLLQATQNNDSRSTVLDPIPIADVIRSQNGVLVRKRSHILGSIEAVGSRVSPIKRLAIFRRPNWFRKIKNRRRALEMRKSRCWILKETGRCPSWPTEIFVTLRLWGYRRLIKMVEFCYRKCTT